MLVLSSMNLRIMVLCLVKKCGILIYWYACKNGRIYRQDVVAADALGGYAERFFCFAVSRCRVERLEEDRQKEKMERDSSDELILQE